MTSLGYHSRNLRAVVRRGDLDALDAMLDWSAAEVWYRAADGDHVHVPVIDAPWVLRVRRGGGMPASVRLGGHSWSNDLPADEHLIARVLERTAHLPIDSRFACPTT